MRTSTPIRQRLALTLALLAALAGILPTIAAAALVTAPVAAWRSDGDSGGEGGDAGSDDTGGGDAGSDTGDDASDDDDSADDDDGTGTPELVAARKAAAAANKELNRIKRENAEAQTKAKAEAGKWQELYEETKAELDKVNAEREQDAKRTLAVAALSKLGSKNPARHVRLLDLDDIEDDTTAERAARRLKREDPDLFQKVTTRQRPAAGDDEDDDKGSDDDDKGTGNGSQPKRPVNRLRRGLEASTPK